MCAHDTEPGNQWSGKKRLCTRHKVVVLDVSEKVPAFTDRRWWIKQDNRVCPI